MPLTVYFSIFYWHFKGLDKKQTKWAGGRWNDGISRESWCARSDVPGSSGAQLFVGSGLTWLSWLLPRLSGLMMINSHKNQCRYLLVEHDAKVASFVWNSARRIACSADFAARLSWFDGDSKSPGTICWKDQRKVGSFILTKNQPHQLAHKTQNIVKNAAMRLVPLLRRFLLLAIVVSSWATGSAWARFGWEKIVP